MVLRREKLLSANDWARAGEGSAPYLFSSSRLAVLAEGATRPKSFGSSCGPETGDSTAKWATYRFSAVTRRV